MAPCGLFLASRLLHQRESSARAVATTLPALVPLTCHLQEWPDAKVSPLFAGPPRERPAAAEGEVDEGNRRTLRACRKAAKMMNNRMM